MKIVKQSVKILDNIDRQAVMNKIELAGRVCYQSGDLAKEGSASKFIQSIISRGHESVIEHESITVQIITTRAIANQLVRHRLASFSQESTRYCNYSKDKFDNEITVIYPGDEMSNDAYNIWIDQQELAEITYFKLLKLGVKPEEARGVLPLDLKTELIMTANIRQWRHVIKMRTGNGAQPQVIEIANQLLKEFYLKLPALFSDLYEIVQA